MRWGVLLLSGVAHAAALTAAVLTNQGQAPVHSASTRPVEITLLTAPARSMARTDTANASPPPAQPAIKSAAQTVPQPRPRQSSAPQSPASPAVPAALPTPTNTAPVNPGTPTVSDAPVVSASATPAASTAPVASVSPANPATSSGVPSISATVPVRQGVGIGASYAATNPEPPYPALARRLGEQGTVLLRVLVGPDGTARDVQVKKSSGSPTLDRSAQNTIKQWRFNPATIDGKPVEEWYETRWTFKLEG